MKKMILFAVIAILVIACGNSTSENNSSSSAGATNTTASADAPDGEKIYKQYCVTCHGLYGDMGASGAYNLTSSTLSLEERLNVITNGREGTTMVGFKSILDEEKIKAVAQYIEKLRK